ncbi:WD repeat-containing protein GTS1 [Typha latifolia]|uniref:WD repeat-containing protein GTS1 n=1 Tax=Typha latifolia TaxID=4733 RepID=UPI003C2B213D
MEEEMDMVVENFSSSSSSSPKRLGLRNAIQTNFGDDYVFQIASSQEISSLAVSLSTNTIKCYSPETGQYFGECRGHSETIHEISFSAPSSAHVICSCSSDGTIRAWDTRSFKQISLLKAGSSQEIFSFSFGGSSGNLLAGGSNAQVLFWDWRNGKQVACLEESHIDDVTQVRFVPSQQSKLISSSVDGLLCLFDAVGDINDDNHLLSVMNVGTSIGKIGFHGNMNEKLWCLTHIETISIWDWNDARSEVIFEDARSMASDRWNLDHVDYFVDCHYSVADDRLWVIGGTSSGTLGYFPVSLAGIGSAEATLEGGHAGVVRTVLPASSVHGGSLLQNKGIFGWTGGEDGRLCCWLSDESSEANRSWISSALVMKSQKGRIKVRHHPY